jgi:hypothetical protein
MRNKNTEINRENLGKNEKNGKAKRVDDSNDLRAASLPKEQNAVEHLQETISYCLRAEKG